MVTSSAAWEPQDLRLGWLWASAFLHAGVIAAVVHVRSNLPSAEPVAPTLLVGTSFEVLVDEAGPAPAAPAPELAGPPLRPDQSTPAQVGQATIPAPRADAPRVVPSVVSPEVSTETSPRDRAAAAPQDTSSASPSVMSAPARQKTGSAPAQTGSVDYGQEGKEGAPAQLRRAFIKMLPLAAKLDPSWLNLPTMSLGRGRFLLRLNEQGQLASVDVRSGDAHPALVRAMQKNRAFLGMRRFSSKGAPSERSIMVDVSGQVSKKSPQVDAEDKVIALGVRIDPRDPQAEPRGAYFTYDNGQHVELVWTVVQD